MNNDIEVEPEDGGGGGGGGGGDDVSHGSYKVTEGAVSPVGSCYQLDDLPDDNDNDDEGLGGLDVGGIDRTKQTNPSTNGNGIKAKLSNFRFNLEKLHSLNQSHQHDAQQHQQIHNPHSHHLHHQQLQHQPQTAQHHHPSAHGVEEGDLGFIWTGENKRRSYPYVIRRGFPNTELPIELGSFVNVQNYYHPLDD